MMPHVGFLLIYLDLTLTYSECQLDRSNGVLPDISVFLLHCFNGVERCYPSRQCGRLFINLSVRMSRNVRLCTANKRVDLEASFFAFIFMLKDMFACIFLMKLSTSVTFIFKVKYSNRDIKNFVRDYFANGDRYDKFC